MNDGKPIAEEKYGPLKRIRRRHAEYMAGDFLPSVPIESMTFEPLRKRG